MGWSQATTERPRSNKPGPSDCSCRPWSQRVPFPPGGQHVGDLRVQVVPRPCANAEVSFCRSPEVAIGPGACVSSQRRNIGNSTKSFWGIPFLRNSTATQRSKSPSEPNMDSMEPRTDRFKALRCASGYRDRDHNGILQNLHCLSLFSRYER